MASDSITILHLSDVQFGRHHRFGSDEPFDNLYQRLEDDLRLLADEHDLRPQIVAVTGDLAEWGRPKEFEEARVLLERLEGFLDLPRERIAVIPGNHDVSRAFCEAYFKECEAVDETPRPPYWRKWKPYAEMFAAFYRDVPGFEFTEDEPWTLYPIRDLRLVLAGLNSTMAESHRKKDHYGHVGEGQMRWFAERLARYRDEGWLRIGLIHHNVVRGAAVDDENLRDSDDLERILGPHLNLVLHGHTHDGRLHWLRSNVPIVSTGSAGLKTDNRPAEVPNQYQVLRIGRDRLERCARLYAPNCKSWIGDTRFCEKRDSWRVENKVTFERVESTFTGTSREEIRFLDDEPRFHDDFLARVEIVCRLRVQSGTEIRAIRRDTGMPYLSVTETVGDFVNVYPVGACSGALDEEALDAFLTIHRRYSGADRGVRSTLVHGDAPVPDELRRRAASERVRLRSFLEYQGLIDFRDYLASQTRTLADDPIYPPDLYVPQRMKYLFGREEHEEDAFTTIRNWLFDDTGRFILVLGDFGTGKTFLLHELARRLAEEEDSIAPVLVEMRDLEKSHDLDVLVAQHFAVAEMDGIQRRAFHYMLEQGRIVLLFDGFDELALRVTYDRAGDHIKTLVQAARRDAKVVVTSRTQYFESEEQIRTALGHEVERIAGRRIVRLQSFDERQIRRFLLHRLKDEKKAHDRFHLIDEIKDLLGLSANPRMLGFIADLPDKDLLAAKNRSGERGITAAELYRMLLERWLIKEYDRQQPQGALPALTVKERWTAVTQLALRLWQRTEKTLEIGELTAEVGHTLVNLAEGISAAVAAHQVGSGTLLVRLGEGRFTFFHQSILEWLVARRAAEELRRDGNSDVLTRREMSPLMADFLCDLAGHERVAIWSNRTLHWQTDDKTARHNALLVRMRLGTTARTLLRKEILRGRDFSGQAFIEADFSGADLTSTSFVGSDLTGALLTKAVLVRANLSKAVLRDADLTDADLSEANLLEAKLIGAKLEGIVFSRTKLVGAELDIELAAGSLRGSAPPQPSTAAPWVWLPNSPCRVVAWSPDGSVVATGHEDATVRLWDASSGQEIRRFLGHQSSVLSVCFSPRGNWIASGSLDNTVRVWDIDTGKQTRLLQGHLNSVRSVCFSPQEDRLASGSSDNTVRVWDIDTGEQTRLLQGHLNSVWSVCFSPRGDHLASGSLDTTVRVWEVDTGKQARLFQGHQNSVWSVCFSPKGNRLASGSEDQMVRLWDVDSGKQTKLLRGHQSYVLSVCFSPNGNRLASGSYDGTVRLWDVDSGKQIKLLQGHQRSVWSVCFSPQGDRLASGSDDGTVRLWDIGSGRLTKHLQGYQRSVWSVSFSPREDRLASGSYDNVVRLWDVGSGRLTKHLQGHQSYVLSVCFSPGGDRLASGSDDNTVRLWDVNSGRETKCFQGHQSYVLSVCFSPGGNRLASGSDDNTVRLWDVPTGDETKRLQGHQSSVRSVCFSPRGNQLASGSDDNTVRLWDADTGNETQILKGHQRSVVSVCFSPQGDRLASGSDDNTVRLWDAITGNETTILHGHQRSVRSVCFSPRGDRLASGSEDNTVRLWDVDSGEETKILRGHQRSVRSICFSRHGDRLASGSDDNTIRIWDIGSGRCLAVLVPLPEGWVTYTLDGRYKVGGETSGGVWHSIGLCRFEVGELDPYMDLRVPEEEPLLPGLAGARGEIP